MGVLSAPPSTYSTQRITQKIMQQVHEDLTRAPSAWGRFAARGRSALSSPPSLTKGSTLMRWFERHTSQPTNLHKSTSSRTRRAPAQHAPATCFVRLSDSAMVCSSAVVSTELSHSAKFGPTSLSYLLFVSPGYLCRRSPDPPLSIATGGLTLIVSRASGCAW